MGNGPRQERAVLSLRAAGHQEAADMLARRIVWADNLWFALRSIPKLSPEIVSLVSEYETLRNDDNYWIGANR